MSRRKPPLVKIPFDPLMVPTYARSALNAAFARGIFVSLRQSGIIMKVDRSLTDWIDTAILRLIQSGAGEDQTWSLRIKQIITGAFYLAIFGFAAYSTYANYCPSAFVIRYSPVVWVLLGLGFSIFVIRKCGLYREPEKIPRWKRIAGPIVIVLGTLWFTRTALIYGVTALFNGISGEPFHGQTVVIDKFWGTRLCQPNVKLANFDSFREYVCCDKSEWKELSKGDVVTVSGIRSFLGRAIDQVSIPRSRISTTTESASKGDTEPADRTLAGQSGSQGRTAHNNLLRACEDGDLHGVQLALSEQANVNAVGGVQKTPLQYAAMAGDIEITRLLFDKGANIHFKDAGGRTAFYFACVFGHLDIAELLTNHGASIDEPDAYGITPLMVACLTGRTDVVKYLLDKGANVNAKDGSGNTPLLAATKNSPRPKIEIVKLLEERGAKE